MVHGENGAVLSSEGEEGSLQGPRSRNHTRRFSISISITFSSEDFLTAGKVRCDRRVPQEPGSRVQPRSSHAGRAGSWPLSPLLVNAAAGGLPAARSRSGKWNVAYSGGLSPAPDGRFVLRGRRRMVTWSQMSEHPLSSSVGQSLKPCPQVGGREGQWQT